METLLDGCPYLGPGALARPRAPDGWCRAGRVAAAIRYASTFDVAVWGPTDMSNRGSAPHLECQLPDAAVIGARFQNGCCQSAPDSPHEWQGASSMALRCNERRSHRPPMATRLLVVFASRRIQAVSRVSQSGRGRHRSPCSPGREVHPPIKRGLKVHLREMFCQQRQHVTLQQVQLRKGRFVRCRKQRVDACRQLRRRQWQQRS